MKQTRAQFRSVNSQAACARCFGWRGRFLTTANACNLQVNVIGIRNLSLPLKLISLPSPADILMSYALKDVLVVFSSFTSL